MPSEISEKIKKNLLDLHHNKYLQYFNTTVIVMFTYFIGVVIALLTKQIDYAKPSHLIAIALISTAVFGITTLLLLNFKWHMNNVIEEIRKLALNQHWLITIRVPSQCLFLSSCQFL